MKWIHGLACAVVLCMQAAVWGDAGVFTGTGQDLRQISTHSVRLVSIDVKVVLGRGPFLFDGTVPGMDEARYDCTFVLQNLTDNACDVEVGFPVDSEFAQVPKDPKDPLEDWVLRCGFIAKDTDDTYHVKFQDVDPDKVADAYSAIFTWKMAFKPKETRTLTVQYHIPISMTVDSPDKRGADGVVAAGRKHRWMVMLDSCMAEIAGYTTETGSTWSGNVEKATFTVITDPFEKYLNYRGSTEENVSELPADQQKTVRDFFPVEHEWWYRAVTPAGWKAVDDGIQWQYKNYKPRDPLTITYYQMEYPTLASDVDPWVDAILRTIPDKSKQPGELAIVKQILLATYGQAPTDADAKAFCEDQIWYAPKKDFSASKLGKDQRAVVAALDHRINALAKR
ncbi:MAG TPA: hypothetical protein VHY37_11955 [Tepidisphaeraceae bacterium]|jgi:hypothetical protein|nr:hypothetical protein [Tepidisphaeraceae bacterium]